MKRYYSPNLHNKKSVRALNIYDAARQLAYRESNRIYGKNSFIYDCNEIYINDEKTNGEFLSKFVKYKNNNLFTGHSIRFQVLLK